MTSGKDHRMLPATLLNEKHMWLMISLYFCFSILIFVIF